MGMMPFGGPSPFSMMSGMMQNMDNMMRNMVRTLIANRCIVYMYMFLMYICTVYIYVLVTIVHVLRTLCIHMTMYMCM